MAITFAVVGHNEEQTLGSALEGARSAAALGDEVVFIDSASTDSSADVALALGFKCITAPFGKGAAMEVAVRHCSTSHICFLDADTRDSEKNIPASLAQCLETLDVDVVVGDFQEKASVLSNTRTIYEPFVAAVFPEVAGRFGSKPLSGFRLIKVASIELPFPRGFGVESYLNVTGILSGARVGICYLGEYRGRFRYNPTMGPDIVETLLSLAQSRGRINAHAAAGWREWFAPAIEVIRAYRGDADHKDVFRAEVAALAGRTPPKS